MDYSNSWNAARLADRMKNTGSFDVAVDELSLQIERDAKLFRSGVSETKSMAVGFALVASDSAAFVKEATRNCHSFWQASASASMALAKLFGTIPFATGDLAAKVLDASQYGPKATAAKAIELAAEGFINGGLFVAENIGAWFSGGLAGKDIYDTTYEITETLGTAALLVLGIKSIVGGIAKIGGGIAIKPSIPSFSSYSVAAVSEMAINGSAILHGFADIGAGALLMSAVEIRTQHPSQSDRARGAKPPARLSLIERFLKKLESGEIAAPKQTTAAPPKIGRPPRVSLAEIEAALEECKGNKTAAGEKVGLTTPTIKYYIDNYPSLERFRKVPRTPRSKKTPVVSDEKLFELLTKHKGNRTLTAKDAGISPSLVCKRVKNAAPESDLAKFKGVHGWKKPPPPPQKASDTALARALRRRKGNRTHAAKDVGLSTSRVKARIRNAKEGPLVKYKTIRGKGGKRSNVSRRRLAAALKKRNGNKSAAARDLNVSRQVVTQLIDSAPAGSKLARYQEISLKPGGQQVVSDTVLLEAYKRNGSKKAATARDLEISNTTVRRRIRALK